MDVARRIRHFRSRPFQRETQRVDLLYAIGVCLPRIGWGAVQIAETAVFTRQVQDLLDPESYRLLQLELADRPDRGTVIVGSGGLRKIRWQGSGGGKRGGTRVIYFWARDRDTILMLLAYAKADQEDLTAEQLKILRRVVKEEFG